MATGAFLGQWEGGGASGLGSGGFGPSSSLLADPVITNEDNISSVGDELRTEGGDSFSVNNAWPVANVAIYIPFRVSGTGYPAIASIGFRCAVTASGNYDLGVFDHNGNALARKGSTAVVLGLNTYTLGGLAVASEPYIFLGMAVDNTTAQIRSVATGINGVRNMMMGITTISASFPLPASFTKSKTPVATFAGYMPLVFRSNVAAQP